jgi:lambda family phage portal protein
VSWWQPWTWFRTASAAPSQQRSYAGARFGRLEADWTAGSGSQDTEIQLDLRLLRNRSRQLVRDNDYARGALRVILNNVVGSGIGLQAQVPMQRSTGKMNERINTLIEEVWAAWCCAEYCDTSGKLSFPEIERLVLRSIIESGEVLVRFIPQKFENSPVPFALEILEADQLADDYSVGLSAYGNQIKMGVEFDDWRRPVAYWVYPYHPGDFQFRYKPQGNSPQRIPASEILHLFVSDRPGQTRGVPWFHSSLLRLRNLGGYEEAELVAARAQAAVMGFISTPDPEGIGEEFQGDRVDSLEPGAIKMLAPGEQFSGFSPTRPGDGFDPFVRMMLRGVAAGLGLSYESLSRDYTNTSYSSARVSLIDERDHWRVLQQWLIKGFHQKVFDRWLDLASMSGALTLPNYGSNPRFYQKIRWCCRGWAWVDPQKDVAATKEEIKAGLSTATAAIAEQGKDIQDVLKERRRELDLAKQYELAFDIDPAAAQDAGGEQPQAEAQSQAAPETQAVVDQFFGAMGDGRAIEEILADFGAKRVSNIDLAVEVVQNRSLSSSDQLTALNEMSEMLRADLSVLEGFKAVIAQKQFEVMLRSLEDERDLNIAIWLTEQERATGKKNCKKGKACGNSCIAQNRQCKSELPAAAAKATKATAKAKSTAKGKKGTKPAVEAKAKIDPNLHEFYDFMQGDQALTKAEEKLVLQEVGVLNKYQESKVQKLQKDGITLAEAAAFENYIGSEYSEMNKALYSSKIEAEINNDAWQSQMLVNKAAASAMKKMPPTTEAAIQDVINDLAVGNDQGYKPGNYMIRHENIPNLQAYLTKHREALESGEPLIKEQFLSTTFAQEGLGYFKNKSNVEVRIKAKLDGTGNSVLVDKYKNTAFESEVLFKPMTAFKVTKVDYQPEQEITMEKFVPTANAVKYKSLSAAYNSPAISSFGSFSTGLKYAIGEKKYKEVQKELGTTKAITKKQFNEYLKTYEKYKGQGSYKTYTTFVGAQTIIEMEEI